ncbi:hypothetical protein AAZX31_11G166500 [Glycine max]
MLPEESAIHTELHEGLIMFSSSSTSFNNQYSALSFGSTCK